jgi:hypothetical protein
MKKVYRLTLLTCNLRDQLFHRNIIDAFLLNPFVSSWQTFTLTSCFDLSACLILQNDFAATFYNDTEYTEHFLAPSMVP